MHPPRPAPRPTSFSLGRHRRTAAQSAVLLFAATIGMSGFAIAARAATTPCTGVALTAGQTDIDAHDEATTFCISGTHAWSLVPKAGDVFVGGTLDGGGTVAHAFSGRAANVTISDVRVVDYDPTKYNGAIDATGDAWTLNNVSVSGSAYDGVAVGGADWKITGGRIYDNGQLAIEGGSRETSGMTVDGVELDHNGFDDATYLVRKVACRYGSGGVKFKADEVTIRNSFIHDNACQGIWSNLGADGISVLDNRVDDNWDEGIFVDITSNAVVQGNEVSGNGLNDTSGTARLPCGSGFGQGAGISLDTSGQTHTVTGTIDVGANTVSGNCNGITGLDQVRTAVGCSIAPVCELRNVTVHDNTIVGSAVPGAGNASGWSAYDGRDLEADNLTWSNNDLSGGIVLSPFTTPTSTSNPATTTSTTREPTTTTTVPPTTTTTTLPTTGACTRTISAPASISAAESSAAPGDVVCLRGGVYDQSVNLSRAGTASAPITVTSYPGETAIFDGTGLALGSSSGIVGISGNYVTLTDVELRNSSGRGVSVTGTGDVVSDSKLHDMQYNALIAAGANEVIQGNEVWNTVLSNLNDAFGDSGWAEAVNTWQAKNTTFRDNYIHDNWGEGIDFIASNGGVVDNNTIVDNFSVLIYIDGSSNISITNNHLSTTKTTFYRGSSAPAGVLVADESGSNGVANITIADNVLTHTSGISSWNVQPVNLVVTGNVIS